MPNIVIENVPADDTGLQTQGAVTAPQAHDFRCYPNGNDLANYITSLNIINPNSLTLALEQIDCNFKAQAAAQQWEDWVCWRPYLAGFDLLNQVFGGDPTTQVRYFDPPGPNPSGTSPSWSRGGGYRLNLRAGLLSLSLLRTGVQQGPLGINASPTVLTQWDDFTLIDCLDDYNCLQKGRPYEVIDFIVPRWGARGTIEVTGVWGKCLKLKPNVWEAILKYGAVLCYQQLTLNISRGLLARKDLNTEIKYSGRTTPVESEMTYWRQQVMRLVANEMRT